MTNSSSTYRVTFRLGSLAGNLRSTYTTQDVASALRLQSSIRDAGGYCRIERAS
jgi:hypothetical protein